MNYLLKTNYFNVILNMCIFVLNYSILTVGSVTSDHEGNYTCVPSNASPSSVQVHVVQGNHIVKLYLQK